MNGWDFCHDRNKNVKLLIMDEGSIDLFSTPLNPTSSQVQAIANKFKAFLQRLQTDSDEFRLGCNFPGQAFGGAIFLKKRRR